MVLNTADWDTFKDIFDMQEVYVNSEVDQLNYSVKHFRCCETFISKEDR